MFLAEGINILTAGLQDQLLKEQLQSFQLLAEVGCHVPFKDQQWLLPRLESIDGRRSSGSSSLQLPLVLRNGSRIHCVVLLVVADDLVVTENGLKLLLRRARSVLIVPIPFTTVQRLGGVPVVR